MDIGGINPVYRPSVVQETTRPVSQPSPDSAATDLASTAVVPKSASTAATSDGQDGGANLDRRVIIDPDTQDIVFQSVDDVTQSVVRQYPDQAMLRRKAYFVKLDAQHRNETTHETTTSVERRA